METEDCNGVWVRETTVSFGTVREAFADKVTWAKWSRKGENKSRQYLWLSSPGRPTTKTKPVTQES